MDTLRGSSFRAYAKSPTTDEIWPSNVADEAEDYGPERAKNAPSFFYSRRATLSVAAGVLALGVATSFAFGVGVMGWSYLQSVYFFAITVSTIGFGACGVREKDEQIYLLFYMWLCVVLFGVGLALIIQAAHGTAENLLATKSAGAQDDDDDAGRLLGARPRPRASRALRTARWRIQVLSYKLVLILSEGLLVLLLATWFMAWCEGWSLLTAAIFATEALTSIGFGDSLPATRAGKVFTIFYALFGTFVFARFLAFAVWYPKHWRDYKKLRAATRAATQGLASDGRAQPPPTAADRDRRRQWTRHVFELRRDTGAAGDGPIAKEDFALHLLLSLGKIDVEDVLDAHDVFHLLAAGDDKLSLETALDAADHDAPDRAAYGPPRTPGGDDDDEVEETKSPFASW